MKTKRVLLAAAAAALFTAGVGVHPGLADQHEKGEMVKCKGVNGCKGQSDCASASHDCSGKNECKGKGWKKMTPEECDKAKAEMKG